MDSQWGSASIRTAARTESHSGSLQGRVPSRGSGLAGGLRRPVMVPPLDLGNMKPPPADDRLGQQHAFCPSSVLIAMRSLAAHIQATVWLPSPKAPLLTVRCGHMVYTLTPSDFPCSDAPRSHYERNKEFRSTQPLRNQPGKPPSTPRLRHLTSTETGHNTPAVPMRSQVGGGPRGYRPELRAGQDDAAGDYDSRMRGDGGAGKSDPAAPKLSAMARYKERHQGNGTIPLSRQGRGGRARTPGRPMTPGGPTTPGRPTTRNQQADLRAKQRTTDLPREQQSFMTIGQHMAQQSYHPDAAATNASGSYPGAKPGTRGGQGYNRQQTRAGGAGGGGDQQPSGSMGAQGWSSGRPEGWGFATGRVANNQVKGEGAGALNIPGPPFEQVLFHVEILMECSIQIRALLDQIGTAHHS